MLTLRFYLMAQDHRGAGFCFSSFVHFQYGHHSHISAVLKVKMKMNVMQMENSNAGLVAGEAGKTLTGCLGLYGLSFCFPNGK